MVTCVGAGQAKILHDLGDVSVSSAHAVGRRGSEALRRHQVGLRRLACTGVAVGQHGNEVSGLDQSGGDRRLDAQGHRGDIAPGHGNAVDTLECVTLPTCANDQFWKSVRPGAGVLAAVELRPLLGGLQPEIGSAVDHQDVIAELGSDGPGLAVRQAQEHHVVSRQDLGGRGLQDAIGQGHEMRMVLAERCAGARCGRERADLDVGVCQEQSQYFAAGVPARAGNSCRDRGHRSTFAEISW